MGNAIKTYTLNFLVSLEKILSLEKIFCTALYLAVLTEVGIFPKISKAQRTKTQRVFEISEAQRTKAQLVFEISKAQRTKAQRIFEISEAQRTKAQDVFDIKRSATH